MQWIAPGVGVALLAIACNNNDSSSSSSPDSTGSSTGTTTIQSTDGTATDAPTSTGDSTSDSTGDPTGAPAVCPDNLQPAPGSEFCLADSATPDCDRIGPEYHTQVCGVAVLDATELGRSMGVVANSGDGPPDLGCFVPANYPKQGASQLVAMQGVVRIFSHGCESKEVIVEIFEAVDAGLGPQLIGGPIITAADCSADGVPGPDADCGTRHECKYFYPAVPTEKPLVVRTRGVLWAQVNEYNVYIPNAEVQGGVWSHDLRALAADDYNVFAQVAIGAPLPPGSGMVLGEVHDCGDVRLTGATVDTEVEKQRIAYFNDDETHPLPDVAATWTGPTGLYGLFAVSPGELSVAAIGNMLGEPRAVGYHRVTVFPDAVTYVPFRGVRPYQVGP